MKAVMNRLLRISFQPLIYQSVYLSNNLVVLPIRRRWEVIGLHHAGGWVPEKKDGPVYFRNKGISMKAILDDLPVEIKEHLNNI